MSNYNEAPYLSRTDWVTIPEAAQAVQRRPNQVRGWVIDGKVVSCKQGRRRLVSLESCQDFVQRAPNQLQRRNTPATWSRLTSAGGSCWERVWMVRS
jgi:hypothetical protein